MLKPVLIIVRNFIPYYPSFGGVVRILKMAEFLSQQGIPVVILTAKGDFCSFFGYEELFKSLEIEYIDDWSQQRISIRNSLQKKSILGKILQKILPKVRQFLFDFCVPDSSKALNKKFFIKAVNIIQSKKIENIIISSPPHSTQLIAIKLKKKFKQRILVISDLRDSWNTGMYRKKNRLLQILNHYYERKVLSIADHITYTTSLMLKEINHHIVDINEKSTLVMNGYDAKMKVDWQPFQTNKILNIGYFGKIDAMQEPTLFLESLQQFSSPLCFSTYGAVYDFSKYQVNSIHNINHFPSLPHKQALEKMRTMDILLIIISHKNADYVVPGKFFDYLLAQRPILFIGNLENECAKIIEKNNLGYVSNLYDKKNVQKVLQQIYRDWKCGDLNEYEGQSFLNYSRQYQYKKLLNIFRF